jgi:dTDP-4-dehydrorhamnose 3,5-epimerase
MGSISVDQILVTPLERIPLKGGDVLHAMKCTDPGFVDFGEAYFSLIDIDAIKAWKRHLRMTLNIMVPLGAVQFVFINDQGVMREEVIGLDRYIRLTIPPGIWFGFRGLVAPYSLLMNIADTPHDPAEIERKELGAFKFQWEPKR